MDDAFAVVKRTTPCPYALGARISYGPQWDPALGLANSELIAQSLAEWAKTARTSASHGFVIGIYSPEAADFGSVTALLKTALQHLSHFDPNQSDCLQRDIEQTDWQFEFAGLRLFVNVFAPCYPPGHGKRVEDPERVFLFFQPEYSFDICGVNRDNLAAKRMIRRRFAEAGSPYSGELIDQRVEAYLYMLPLDPGDPPVRWWE
ncbi:MAG TPA: YqcI/YcgG family protein [Solirubrobacterales bacterium]